MQKDKIPQIAFYIDGENLRKRAEEESRFQLRKKCEHEVQEGFRKIPSNKDKTLVDEEYQALVEKKFKSREFKEVIRTRFVDLRGLCIKLALEIAPKFDLTIHFYGSRFPIELDRSKYHADLAYYRFLDESGIIFREGRFLWDKEKFEKHGHLTNLREKGVDVLLAVDLITHVLNKKFDDVVVISQDTDLMPAFEAVSKLDHVNLHVRSIKKMTGFNPFTKTNASITITTLKSVYKPKRAASEASIESLASKFNKK